MSFDARAEATANDCRRSAEDAEKVKDARLDQQRRLPGPALRDWALQIQRQRQQSRRDAGASNGNVNAAQLPPAATRLKSRTGRRL